MQTNITTQTSSSLLIDRTTLWDNSSKDDDNNQEKCVAPLTDHAWRSVSSLKDLIDSKYGLNTINVSNKLFFKVICFVFYLFKNNNNTELIPWTNSDLQQVKIDKKIFF